MLCTMQVARPRGVVAEMIFGFNRFSSILALFSPLDLQDKVIVCVAVQVVDRVLGVLFPQVVDERKPSGKPSDLQQTPVAV